MPPEFSENGPPREHPLEELFKAPGWDILSAIAQGRRARTDVRGKLAEFYLNRYLEARRARVKIDRHSWNVDGLGALPADLRNVGERNRECRNSGYRIENGRPTSAT